VDCNSIPVPYAMEPVSAGDANLTNAERDEYVYFDSCANTCTVRDMSLVTDMRPGGRAMGISGSVPGEKLVTNIYGILGDLGGQPVSTDFKKNLISHQSLLAAGWSIRHDSSHSPHYFCNKEGHTELVCELDSHGTYWTTILNFKSKFPEVYRVSANYTDVERSMKAHHTYPLPNVA